MPSFPAKLGPGAFDTSPVGDPCPGQTGDLPASLALPGGGPPALGQDMAPASQLTASREGQGVVGGCREGSPVGVSLSFLPHPVSIQQSQAGCGGEETSGPQSGALVLVQVPGRLLPPGRLGRASCPPFHKAPSRPFVQSQDMSCCLLPAGHSWVLGSTQL